MLYKDLYIFFITWPSEACVRKCLALGIKRLGTTDTVYKDPNHMLFSRVFDSLYGCILKKIGRRWLELYRSG